MPDVVPPPIVIPGITAPAFHDVYELPTEVESHLPGEGPGGVGGSGCGGGGDLGQDPMAKCASPPVAINCTGGRIERGDSVSCTANTEMDTIGDVRYMWTSNVAGVKNSHAGNGPAYQTWTGTATASVGLHVMVSASTETGSSTVKNTRTLTVHPRYWRLQEQGAPLQHVAPIPGAPGRWGRYRFSAALKLQVGEGTGPWAGHHFVAGTPWIGNSEMYAHSDLVEGPPEYMLTDTICNVLPNERRSVFALNKVCGNSGTLAAFNRLVVAHEKKHQTSLNECIRSANSGRLAEIEKLVGDYETVDKGLKDKWTHSVKGLAPGLRMAGETAQRDQESGSIWERRGQWGWRYRTVELEDHNGRQGC